MAAFVNTTPRVRGASGAPPPSRWRGEGDLPDSRPQEMSGHAGHSTCLARPIGVTTRRGMGVVVHDGNQPSLVVTGARTDTHIRYPFGAYPACTVRCGALRIGIACVDPRTNTKMARTGTDPTQWSFSSSPS